MIAISGEELFPPNTKWTQEDLDKKLADVEQWI